MVQVQWRPLQGVCLLVQEGLSRLQLLAVRL